MHDLETLLACARKTDLGLEKSPFVQVGILNCNLNINMFVFSRSSGPKASMFGLSH